MPKSHDAKPRNKERRRRARDPNLTEEIKRRSLQRRKQRQELYSIYLLGVSVTKQREEACRKLGLRWQDYIRADREAAARSVQVATVMMEYFRKKHGIEAEAA